MRAVFQSTGQALHISFLIMSVEPRQDGALRKALLQIMEAIEQPTRAQQAWMDQLRGTPSGVVNFGGLTSDEVRAQCAMVTQSVKTHLPAPEMWTIQAKFGATEHEEIGRDKDGKAINRFYFSKERIEAIQALSNWMRASHPKVPMLAMDCLVAKLFANHAKTEISFRELEANFGASRMLYARAMPKMKQTVRDLEEVAIRRLTPYFEESGLVESEQISC